ncbi:PLP-dependent aminotransferase family protein [Peribacillus sp. NPDC096540]|uniref:aminotransferase-like domain-containing protein n=1 Tax=Peribacillus sp. NPDC096540 TaxID=3390612 RepID=UPI003D01F2FB
MYNFAKRMEEVSASAVREIIKLMSNPEIISFGGGSPANESFPIDTIQDIIDKALRENGNQILQYGVTEGWKALREAYLEHIAYPKGISASLENVITITGATQGIQLISDVFLDPGDVVLVESPTFLSTLMVFNKNFIKCVPVETDEHGMIMEDLEEKIKRYHPKMLYSIPTFQNPTGITLPLERRKKIAELASTFNMMVMEDDPYGDLRYRGEALPPIKSFDQTGHVILLNSFSKTISPGLRVGTVLAEPEIIQKLIIAKQCADTHTTNLTQVVCAEFLNRGLLPGHLKAITPIYSARMDAMLEGIKNYFPTGTQYIQPEGGLFIWAELPGEPDMQALLEKAVRDCKVAFVPGKPFFVNPEDGRKSLRLNFSSNTPERIEEGMKRLGGVLSGIEIS